MFFVTVLMKHFLCGSISICIPGLLFLAKNVVIEGVLQGFFLLDMVKLPFTQLIPQCRNTWSLLNQGKSPISSMEFPYSYYVYMNNYNTQECKVYLLILSVEGRQEF